MLFPSFQWPRNTFLIGCAPVTIGWTARGQGLIHDRLRFDFDALQMLLAENNLRINLKNILPARWMRSEPALLGDHL